MICLNLPLLLGVSSVPVLYATMLTSLSVLGLHHYLYDDLLISSGTYPTSLSTAANLSLIDSFTKVEYTNTEYTDMVLVYGEVPGNGRTARRVYQERYPHRVTPSNTPFAKVIKRLLERDTFIINRVDCGAPRRRRTPDFEEDVLHRVEETPTTSTRTIALGKGVPHSTVWGFCIRSNYTLTIPRGCTQ